MNPRRAVTEHRAYGVGCSSGPNTISQSEKMLDAQLSSSREMQRLSRYGTRYGSLVRVQEARMALWSRVWNLLFTNIIKLGFSPAGARCLRSKILPGFDGRGPGGPPRGGRRGGGGAARPGGG